MATTEKMVTSEKTTAALDSWLNQAMRHLSRNSAAQVQTEIRQHYEAAREAAIAASPTLSEQEASRKALAALGDAKAANCQYRQVLLTSAEARLLREGNWEARAICSRPRIKWLLLATPVALLCAAEVMLLKRATSLAQTLLVGGIVMAILFAAPFLPVYTPSRARIFRALKWITMLATLLLIFGPDTLKWSWLLFSCLWPIFWIERTRASIRRKLPVAQWPRQLYL